MLVVDDCFAIADGMALLLQMSGHDARVASTGADALAAAASFDPDVVIVDVGRPEARGFEVARELRARHPRCFLVTFTGYRRAVDEQRATEAGCNMHIGKPIGVHVLNEVVRASQPC